MKKRKIWESIDFIESTFSDTKWWIDNIKAQIIGKNWKYPNSIFFHSPFFPHWTQLSTSVEEHTLI